MDKKNAEEIYQKIEQMFNIKKFDYDIALIKQLKKSNTLDSTNTNQTHIAITGEQMDAFPYLSNYEYLVNNNNDFKKKFILKLPVQISKNNINYLKNNSINLKDTYIKTYTFCNRSRQNTQMELSYLKFEEHVFKEDFRKNIHIDDILIIFKERSKLNYYFFAIKSSDFKLKLNNIKLSGDVYFDKTNPGSGENVTEVSLINVTEVLLTHNRIIYGAPGTGKSWKLRNEVEQYFYKENTERVTFYPGYTYGQFVGTYKPKPIYKDNLNNEIYHTNIENPGKNHEPIISYEFTPGILMKILVKALNNSSENYCLIIEEINRVKVDSVFGDFFQLLDRGEDGKSEYVLKCSEDLLTYLNKEIEDKESDIIKNGVIYLPSNLYIWATMNSADQGVYPMDTAFKRRWNFEYISLNEGEKHFEDYFVKLGKDKTKKWNKVREFINNAIKDTVSEDRLLAPFFVKENDFIEENGIKYLKPEIYINKVIMYLKEDILRHRKVNSLFYKEKVNFNDLYTKYNNGEGENILKIPSDEEEKEKQEIQE